MHTCLTGHLVIKRPGKANYTWKPNTLNAVLRFGVDPRSAADAFPLLKQLASNVFDLPDDVSDQTQETIGRLLHVSRMKLVGPRFKCPVCRSVLLRAPVRSFAIDAWLDALPEEIDETTASEELKGRSREENVHDNNGEGSSTGKGKEREERETEKTFDWSQFFGEDMGAGVLGY